MENKETHQQLPSCSRLNDLRTEPYRVEQELLGLRAQKPSLRERYLSVRPSVFSFGEHDWKHSEVTPYNTELNKMFSDFNKKLVKGKIKYLSKKTGSTQRKNLEYFIEPLRHIAGLHGRFRFCMVGDCHGAIRDYMNEIGWKEKFTAPEERAILTKALQKSPSRENRDAVSRFIDEDIDFIWVVGHLNWSCIHPGVVVNRVPLSYTNFSKITLSTNIKNQLPFIYVKGKINVRTPRTYEIREQEDMNHFSREYRINACISLLKKICQYKVGDEESIFNVKGMVPIDCLDFAFKRVIERIGFFEHADLDEWCHSFVTEEEWTWFLHNFYDISNLNAMFQIKDDDTKKLVANCQNVLDSLCKYLPEIKYEGTMNLWICKPAFGSCGRGVKVLQKLSDVKNYCQTNEQYVIQKYIEEPLLVYSTKFDIRQWFIISSTTPLAIWMYDECYLRFCSQEFSLKNLHESVHLCNNTIQWKYKNGERNSSLPQDNMWDNHRFADYLKYELREDQWLNIQGQMKQTIIATCLSTQEKLVHRPNSFHLYGADFMITPDFKVWLIEVNCHPSMKYSTSVTTKMCKTVLEDALKVGVERQIKPYTSVGKFVEIYKQQGVSPTILPLGKLLSRKINVLQTQQTSSRPWGHCTIRPRQINQNI